MRARLDTLVKDVRTRSATTASVKMAANVKYACLLIKKAFNLFSMHFCKLSVRLDEGDLRFDIWKQYVIIFNLKSASVSGNVRKQRNVCLSRWVLWAALSTQETLL